jgi:hypothetical protein
LRLAIGAGFQLAEPDQKPLSRRTQSPANCLRFVHVAILMKNSMSLGDAIMPVVVACRCGQRFLAQDNLLGRQVACPACGGPLVIPAPPAPAPGFDVLNVDPSLLGGGQVTGPALPGYSGSHTLRPAISPGADWSQAWVIGGIVAGAIGLVVFIIVIAAIATSGGSGVAKNVANSPPVPGPAAPPLAPAPRPAPPPIMGTPRVRPAPTVPAVTPSTTSSSGSGASAVDSPDFGKSASRTKGPSGTSGDHSLAQLPPALQTWHGKGGTKLTGLFKGGDPENPVTNVSWLAGLLPHLGYQAEYERLELHKPSTDDANMAVGHILIPEFQNPLDSRKTWDGFPFDGMALTHFVGMSGIEDARNVAAAQLPRSDPRAGIFGYDAVARPDEITDGLGHTIMVVGSGKLANPWLLGGGATIRGAREPLFDGISGLGSEGLPTPGTVVLMADGSVRTVPKSIDPKVFRAMCTIQGRETVDLETVAPVLPVESLK